MRVLKFRQLTPIGTWHYFEFNDGSCGGVISAALTKFTILPFTGQLDAAGVEIYEGDIVRISKEDDAPLVVQWAPSECAFILFDLKDQKRPVLDLSSDWPTKLVIGNIYQRPKEACDG